MHALLLAVLLGGSARADLPRAAQGVLAERDALVLNRAAHAMNEIYVSPETADQWGEDRLGDAILAVGNVFRVRLGRTRDCVFDLKVVYEDASREEHRGIDLCRTRQVAFDGSQATPSPDAGAEHRVTLVNHSARPIQQVYVSAPEVQQWGDDRLTAGSLSVGDRREVNWRGTCVVDLRVVFENRAAEERRSVDLCATPVLSIQPGWTTSDELPVP